MQSGSNLNRGGNHWLWSKDRKVALARDGHRCQIGIPGICTIDATEVDHILPRALGGTDELGNLRSVCRPCHLGRGMDESARSRSRYSYGRSAVITRDYSR
jgi:5-methylcytosine-specific restriction protein A